MINHNKVGQIRQLAREGHTAAQIAKMVELSPKTVRVYIKSSATPIEIPHRPCIGDYEDFIEDLIWEYHMAGKRVMAKEVHTILVEKLGFGCSYSLVQKYVRKKFLEVREEWQRIFKRHKRVIVDVRKLQHKK